MLKYILLLSIFLTNLFSETKNYNFYENKTMLQSINNKCILINNYKENRFYLELDNCKERPIQNKDTVSFKVKDKGKNLNITFTSLSLESIKYNGKRQSQKILEHYIQWEKDYIENIIGIKLKFYTNYNNKIISSYYNIPNEFNQYIRLDKKEYISVIVAKYINNKVFAMNLNTNKFTEKETISILTKFLNKITFYSKGNEIDGIIKNFNKKKCN